MEANTVCPSCLNLEYDALSIGNEDRTSHGTGFFFPLTRYRQVKLDAIMTASENGCSLCSVIQQGVARFWGDWGNNSSSERLLESTSTEKYDALCIELRPGRSLTVYRAKFEHGIFARDIGLRLEFYTDRDDPKPPISAAFGKGNRVLDTLNAASAAEILNARLKACQNHKGCSVQPLRLPKRVLDVSTAAPKLVEANLLEQEGCRYSSLSHSWGTALGKQPIQTTQATLFQRMQGIDWAELPILFKDAITLTRLLDCRYIWIDALCIIQDDTEDWLDQSTKMSEIYWNSYLNIAATAGTSSSDSLFGDRWQAGEVPITHPIVRKPSSIHTITPTEVGPTDIHVRFSNTRAHWYVLGETSSGRHVECPLLDRAWVLQERLLAPRTAHFTASEMIWECRESIGCECHDMDNLSCIMPQIEQKYTTTNLQCMMPALVDVLGWEKQMFWKICNGRSSEQDCLDFWIRIVEKYSIMCLTKDKDRPFAIAGIAERVHASTGGKYLAGLWSSDIPRSLLWYGTPRSDKSGIRLANGVPSWSWMSRKTGMTADDSCRVIYPRVLIDGFIVDGKLRVFTEGCFCRTMKNHSFGPPVDYGQIELEASSISATLAIRYSGPEDWLPEQEVLLVFEDGRELILWTDCPQDSQESLATGDVVHCFLMGRSLQEPVCEYILVLKQVLNCPGVFRRVGACDTNGEDVIFPSHAPLLRARII